MKIILTQEVTGLGGPGDVVEVKDGYGRNYLLPRGAAVPRTSVADVLEVLHGGDFYQPVHELMYARAARSSRVEKYPNPLKKPIHKDGTGSDNFDESVHKV